jgi:hypothetical protein
VGSVLLGAATLRARALPWWCGVVLIVGFPLTVPLDVAVRGREGYAGDNVGVGGLRAPDEGRRVGPPTFTSGLNFREFPFHVLR